MKTMKHVTRRKAITSGGAVGLGLTAGAIAEANVEKHAHATLCVMNPSEAVRTRARLVGDIETNGKRYGWFDGTLSGVAPDSYTVLFVALQGMFETKLTPLVNREGWQRYRKVEGIFLDPTTRAPLELFLNPFTGETLDVPKFRYVADDVITGEQTPNWRQDREQMITEESEDFAYLGPGGTATTTRVALLKDTRDPAITAVPHIGTWVALGLNPPVSRAV